jgi:hypothetical protein
MRRLLQFGVFAGFLNFLAFWVAAVYLGGDAVNGKAMEGHYFLSSHGHLTEVGRNVFTYSRWHVFSVFITHPLAMLCAWLLNRGRSK